MDKRTSILINLDLTLFTYLSKHKLLNQFINNTLNHPTPIILKKINTFNIFWWKHTPQGFKFWRKVNYDYVNHCLPKMCKHGYKNRNIIKTKDK